MRVRHEGPDALRGLANGRGGVIGLIVGLGAIVFRGLIGVFTRVFVGHADSQIVGRFTNPHVPSLGHWLVLRHLHRERSAARRTTDD